MEDYFKDTVNNFKFLATITAIVGILVYYRTNTEAINYYVNVTLVHLTPMESEIAASKTAIRYMSVVVFYMFLIVALYSFRPLLEKNLHITNGVYISSIVCMFVFAFWILVICRGYIQEYCKNFIDLLLGKWGSLELFDVAGYSIYYFSPILALVFLFSMLVGRGVRWLKTKIQEIR